MSQLQNQTSSLRSACISESFMDIMASSFPSRGKLEDPSFKNLYEKISSSGDFNERRMDERQDSSSPVEKADSKADVHHEYPAASHSNRDDAVEGDEPADSRVESREDESESSQPHKDGDAQKTIGDDSAGKSPEPHAATAEAKEPSKQGKSKEQAHEKADSDGDEEAKAAKSVSEKKSAKEASPGDLKGNAKVSVAAGKAATESKADASIAEDSSKYESASTPQGKPVASSKVQASKDGSKKGVKLNAMDDAAASQITEKASAKSQSAKSAGQGGAKSPSGMASKIKDAADAGRNDFPHEPFSSSVKIERVSLDASGKQLQPSGGQDSGSQLLMSLASRQSHYAAAASRLQHGMEAVQGEGSGSIGAPKTLALASNASLTVKNLPVTAKSAGSEGKGFQDSLGGQGRPAFSLQGQGADSISHGFSFVKAQASMAHDTSKAVNAVQEIMARIQTAVKGDSLDGQQRLNMDINVGGLGRMSLSLMQSGEAISVSLQSDDGATRDHLMDQRDELERSIRDLGFKDVSLDIGSKGDGASRGEQWRRHGSGNGNSESVENVKLAGDAQADLSKILEFSSR